MAPSEPAPFCESGLDVLRDAGLKITPQRAAILEVYSGRRGHWTAQQVYGHLEGAKPSMSLATVYNTLETFEEVGLLRRFNRPDGQTVFDRNTTVHHHAICSVCDEIIDLAIPEEAVAGLLESATDGDFDIDSAEVWYRGTCSGCQAS